MSSTLKQGLHSGSPSMFTCTLERDGGRKGGRKEERKKGEREGGWEGERSDQKEENEGKERERKEWSVRKGNGSTGREGEGIRSYCSPQVVC